MATSPFFHLHAHSHYSVKDAMPAVEQMVEYAASFGQPGLALTDHGLMSGSLKLYKAARKAGIIPFPGSEFYLVTSVDDPEAKKKRYHVGMVALNKRGYEKLVRLSTRSHLRERFSAKPLIDFSDLQALDAKYDIALTTGCYFGLVIQTLVSQGMPAARNVVKSLARHVPLTYVEIQQHNTLHDVDGTNLSPRSDITIARDLYDIANEVGLPVVVTQDSHYCDHEDQPVHDLMKEMVMIGMKPGEAKFPGDGYHLCEEEWMLDHFASLPNVYSDSLDSMKSLLNQNELQLPYLDSYSFRVPTTVANPTVRLKKLVKDGLQRIGKSNSMVYKTRVAEEMSVITDVGFADYFVLIHSIVDWCKSERILVRARGSAAGSLVCYLLGISDVDPLKWNLVFSRFLTRERTKPPDIDLDIEDSRRADVIEWMRKSMDVVQIGTFSTLGYDERTDRGSVVDEYVRMRKRQDGIYFPDYMSDIDSKTQGMLHKLSDLRVKRSWGAHAAGFALGTKAVPIADVLPTMLIASSGNTVTQAEMDDVEDAGFVKVDILGLRHLSTLRMILEYLGRDPADGTEWIPDSDPSTMTMLRKGQADNGIFQLEGWTAARGCREMAVTRTADIVALMALYRPAVLDRGYEKVYIANAKNPGAVKYAHPVVEKYLRETHGVSVFQEQVLQIVTDLGMPVEELNKILKTLKLSGKRAEGNEERMRASQVSFEETCDNAGLTIGQTEYVWELVEGFAAYGFNRAHATSYGVFAYRMAYLKKHHQAEYMAATLASTVGDSDAQVRYAAEARRIGLTIRKPCVNRGKANWTIDNGDLRRGFMAIKGVGLKAAVEIEEHAPYDDMGDLIERTTARIVTGGKSWKKDGTLNGVLRHLQQARALTDLGVNPDKEK